MDKSSCRRECRSRIQSLNPLERREFSLAICNSISALSDFRQAETVFAYSALPEEPDLGALIANHPGKNWAFPKTSSDGLLSFYVASSSTDMIPGHFGISEPDPALHTPAPPASADLILVPGLGFDPLSGARLGRGKGYYDRYLASISGSGREYLPPQIIGVCFSAQLTSLQPESHDFPMHLLVTELGLHIPA